MLSKRHPTSWDASKRGTFTASRFGWGTKNAQHSCHVLYGRSCHVLEGGGGGNIPLRGMLFKNASRSCPLLLLWMSHCSHHDASMARRVCLCQGDILRSRMSIKNAEHSCPLLYGRSCHGLLSKRHPTSWDAFKNAQRSCPLLLGNIRG